MVLVATGSFNPVHKMHVHMLETAKSYLESGARKRYTVVVGGWLSPSHDAYVSRKLCKEWIPAADRAKVWRSSILSRRFCSFTCSRSAKICRAALGDSPLWSVSSWEYTQSNFKNFPYVANAHHHHLQSVVSAAPCHSPTFVSHRWVVAYAQVPKSLAPYVRVVYVGGSDLLGGFGSSLERSLRDLGFVKGIGCVCINRPVYDAQCDAKRYAMRYAPSTILTSAVVHAFGCLCSFAGLHFSQRCSV